jgi:hypothetical protein
VKRCDAELYFNLFNTKRLAPRAELIDLFYTRCRSGTLHNHRQREILLSGDDQFGLERLQRVLGVKRNKPLVAERQRERETSRNLKDFLYIVGMCLLLGLLHDLHVRTRPSDEHVPRALVQWHAHERVLELVVLPPSVAAINEALEQVEK